MLLTIALLLLAFGIADQAFVDGRGSRAVLPFLGPSWARAREGWRTCTAGASCLRYKGNGEHWPGLKKDYLS
jgi:hypothetical protein